MPNWTPNWSNVRWDWGAAGAAAGALRQSADMLDRTAHERSRVAQEATLEWRGGYREQFDTHLSRALRDAGDVAHECREAANHIDGASQRATEEQGRRERERERWRREKEAEERERDARTS